MKISFISNAVGDTDFNLTPDRWHFLKKLYLRQLILNKIQSNLGRSSFTGHEDKKEQNGENDAIGNIAFSEKLQKIVMQ